MVASYTIKSTINLSLCCSELGDLTDDLTDAYWKEVSKANLQAVSVDSLFISTILCAQY